MLVPVTTCPTPTGVAQPAAEAPLVAGHAAAYRRLVGHVRDASRSTVGHSRLSLLRRDAGIPGDEPENTIEADRIGGSILQLLTGVVGERCL